MTGDRDYSGVCLNVSYKDSETYVMGPRFGGNAKRKNNT